jgi:hypothetical protein
MSAVDEMMLLSSLRLSTETVMSGGSALLDRPALSLGEAARDARNASVRLAGFKRGYEAVRGRGNAAVIARARASWGLAVYERAATLVALAEVEDRERAECCGRLDSAVIAGVRRHSR